MREKFEMLLYLAAVAVSIGLLTGLAIYQGKNHASEKPAEYRIITDDTDAPIPYDAESRKRAYEKIDIKR